MGKRACKAVVLLSGGQDSTTALFWAREEFAEVHALSAAYGQRHATELKAAAEIAVLAGVQHTEVSLPLDKIGGSALTDRTTELGAPLLEFRPDGGFADTVAGTLPTSYVPGRNALLLVLAASVAAVQRANAVVIGASQVDYSGYPDCREEFFKALAPAIDAMLPSSCRPIEIVRPFVHASKEAEVMQARSLGPRTWAALARSVTCYNGLRPGCGGCPACTLRAAGSARARLEDPATNSRKRALADQACKLLWQRDDLRLQLSRRDLALTGTGFTLELMPDVNGAPEEGYYGLIGPSGLMHGPLGIDQVVDQLCNEVMQ